MERRLFDGSEYDWLEKHTIILGQTGSYSNGTNTSTSDKDYKGICIPPIEYYLGLESFTGFDTTGSKNFKSTVDDVDVTIFHINKFVKDAMQGVPNNIELLFMRPTDYLRVSELGQILIDNRHLFLSQHIKKRFGGFANSQLREMKLKKASGKGRQDLIEKFGYDTKSYMHAVRMLTSGIEILETGDFSTFRPNREFLLDCRNGRHTFEEALETVLYYDEKLKEAAESTALPETVDVEKINQLLIEINKRGLALLK